MITSLIRAAIRDLCRSANLAFRISRSSGESHGNVFLCSARRALCCCLRFSRPLGMAFTPRDELKRASPRPGKVCACKCFEESSLENAFSGSFFDSKQQRRLWSKTQDITPDVRACGQEYGLRVEAPSAFVARKSERGRTAVPSRNAIRSNCYRFPELRVTGLVTSTGSVTTVNFLAGRGKGVSSYLSYTIVVIKWLLLNGCY